MKDVGEIGQVSSVHVQQVRDRVQVLVRLLCKVISNPLVCLSSVGDCSVEPHGVGLLIQLKSLRQEFEGLPDLVVLLLEPGHLLAGELIYGRIHDHNVVIQFLGEGLEAIDLVLDLLKVQRNCRWTGETKEMNVKLLSHHPQEKSM